MTTEHFDIYFYPGEHEGVEIAARLAERWYSRLERLFGHALADRQPLVLYASHSDFEQTNVVPDEIGDGTGGFTEPQRRRIVLPLAGPLAETDHVIGHELVHAFQFDIAASPGGASGQSPFARLPLWFVEGMAEYISLGRVDANAAMKLRDAALEQRLPSLADLEKPGYFPYQWGHAVFAYIAGRYGEQSIPRLLRAGALSGSAQDAIQTSLGVSAQAFSTEWHAAIHALYDPILSSSAALPRGDRPGIGGSRTGTPFNVGPALSPDGNWIAFLSARDLFAIDLYVADANTGRVVRRLTHTETDPHYSSIQFVNSGAAWDPSSERVAIGTIAGGRAALAIFNARTGRRDREIVLPAVDEIRHPSWAPDGHAIAFSGMRQGLTDLYVYDLAAATLRPLTRDAFADLHPAWSPDSRRIAFATDRFTSDLTALRVGSLRLATVDVATGALDAVPAFETGKHISPQWSADGRSLYFIGDPDGIPNVYRLSLASRRIEQITASGVGVSGITPASPALSVSSSEETIAVSAYEREGYNLHLWRAAEPIGPPRTLADSAASLPPVDRSSAHLALLAPRPNAGLPLAQAYPSARYKARLSLDAMSQPVATIGFGSFGPIAGGGAGFAFSDPLGDQTLVAAVQVGSALTSAFSTADIAFEAAYLRRDRRWTWGVVGEQIPYSAGILDTAPVVRVGEPSAVQRQTVYRETDRKLSGLLLFPFDRARRLELTGGVAQIAFERTVSSTVYSLTTGQQLSRTSDTQPIGSPLNLAAAGAALVFDTTTFGPTSPVRGERYRVEVSPAIGSADYTGVLADYRRYVMPVSFYTVAARVLHYGRYGSGSDDARLHPIFLNDPSLVRGYDALDSFTAPACALASLVGCLPNARFVGSRILVSNLELRVPLLRPFGVTHAMYGPVPMEVAFFADGGVAWNSGESPAVFGGSRPGIGSAGVALRIATAIGVAEFDVVRPFQSSTRRWTIGLALMPGW